MSKKCMGIEQVFLPVVDEDVIQDILERLRQSRPLGSTPLRQLVWVQKQIEQYGPAAAPIDLDMAIAAMLERVITESLFNHRKLENLPLLSVETRQEMLDEFGRDFSRNNTELEAWSALFYRYVRVDLNLRAQELAHHAHLDPRQLRRRFGHGYRRLAEVISRHEIQARTENRLLWMRLKLPPATYAILYGRDETLEQMKNILDVSPPHTLMLTGVGGIGKSALAHAFSDHMIDQQRFSEFVWITLEDETDYPTLLRELAQRIGALHISRLGQNSLEPSLRVQFTRDLTLAVIDNADYLVNLVDLLPRLDRLISPGRLILVARQHPHLFFPTTVITVESLNIESFQQLLGDHARRLRIRKLDTETVKRIYSVTGGNTLAAKLLVSYLDRLPLEHLLGTLGDLPWGEDSLLDYLFKTAWEPLSDNARQVLMAFFFVPLEGAQRSELQYLSMFSQADFDKALSELIVLSLVEMNLDSGSYTIHGLLRVFISQNVPGSVWKSWFQMEQVYMENGVELSGKVNEPYSLALVNSAGAANLASDTLVSLIRRIAPVARRTGKWFLWHRALKKLLDELTIRPMADQQAHAVIYNEIGVSRRWLGEVDSSREALLKAIEIYGESGDFVSQGETLLEIAQLEQAANNLLAAFEAYQRSVAVARRVNLTELLRRALNGLSSLALDQDRPDQACELAKEAFNLMPDEPSGECLSLLSIAYLKQKNFKDSLEMGKHALKVFEEEADYPQQARMHFRLGMVYYANGQPDLALRHLGQGLGMMRAMGDALGQSRLLTNLGAVCSAGEQIEKAEAIWYDAIALQEEIGDEVGKFYTWQGLGKLYQRSGRIQKAEEAFQKAKDIASKYLDLPAVLARLDPTAQTWLSGELGPPQPPEARPGHPPN